MLCIIGLVLESPLWMWEVMRFIKENWGFGNIKKGEKVGWSVSYEKLTCLVESRDKFFSEFETENGMKGRRHFDEFVVVFFEMWSTWVWRIALPFLIFEILRYHLAFLSFFPHFLIEITVPTSWGIEIYNVCKTLK